MILEYKLNIGNDGKVRRPPWIQIGGEMHDPATDTYIGFSPSAANRPYKIPDSVVVLTTNQAVKDRAQLIHDTYPFLNNDADTTAMTDAEVDTYVDAIIADKDIA